MPGLPGNDQRESPFFGIILCLIGDGSGSPAIGPYRFHELFWQFTSYGKSRYA
jgi:hypothetical protein